MSNLTETLQAINQRSRLHTITFRYPKEFLKAVAASLGRVGDTASTSEAETFIREAVNANVEALIEEHCRRRSVLKIKVRRPR